MLDEIPQAEQEAGPAVTLPDRDISAPATALAVGSRVGPYEVREYLGEGGMASVYQVWHTGLHRFEAMKVPRYQGTQGPEAQFVQRLLAEARMAAGLHHPHIVGIHSVSDPGSPLQYFVMEYVAGEDLDRLIHQRGAMPLHEAVPILRQVASALDHAHANGVVHRDIKPANILQRRQSRGSGTRKSSTSASRRRCKIPEGHASPRAG